MPILSPDQQDEAHTTTRATSTSDGWSKAATLTQIGIVLIAFISLYQQGANNQQTLTYLQAETRPYVHTIPDISNLTTTNGALIVVNTGNIPANITYTGYAYQITNSSGTPISGDGATSTAAAAATNAPSVLYPNESTPERIKFFGNKRPTDGLIKNVNAGINDLIAVVCLIYRPLPQNDSRSWMMVQTWLLSDTVEIPLNTQDVISTSTTCDASSLIPTSTIPLN